MTENKKIIQLTPEKIASYLKFSEDALQIGPDGDDFARGTLTAHLSGFIYTAAKKTGEISIYVPPPTFWDWIFKRSRRATALYEVRHMVDPSTIRIPKNNHPVIIVTIHEKDIDTYIRKTRTTSAELSMKSIQKMPGYSPMKACAPHANGTAPPAL